MRRERFGVWLKIRHADTDPELISQALGLVPEYSWKAGEPKDDGGGAHGTRHETYWIARLPPIATEHEFLEGTLMFAALLLERSGEFWAKLRSEGARAEVLVVLGEGSLGRVDLSRELLAMLSRAELSLSVDLADAAEAAA